MARSKKRPWSPGSVFCVPLPDGSFAIGQAIALMMENVVYCLFANSRIASTHDAIPAIKTEQIISALAVTREQLDYGAWPVLGVASLAMDKASFANERFKTKGYVGSITYDAAIAEDLLAAYHRLAPWDNWKDPNYLDGLLLSPDLRPVNPILIRKAGA